MNKNKNMLPLTFMLTFQIPVYWSTGRVRFVLTTCASLCPRRPARYTWGLGTLLSPSLLLWVAASLGGQVCVAVSRLMWLRSVCIDRVSSVRRSAWDNVKKWNGHISFAYNIAWFLSIVICLFFLTIVPNRAALPSLEDSGYSNNMRRQYLSALIIFQQFCIWNE